jgi:hypothetical protein
LALSPDRHPEIDSRQYIFSYLIRSPDDAPADFPILEPERLRIGLFLPRDGPDWFGRRAYPPRIVLLEANAIVVLTHPRYAEPPVRVALPDIVFCENGHILLIGWIRLVTTASSAIHLPYNTGLDRSVSEFVDTLLREYLAEEKESGNESAPSAGHSTFGAPLDIKFGNSLAHALQPGEHLRATWFTQPYQVSRRWGLFRVNTQVGADLVAYTDRRILWITDRCNGRYERYGTVVSSAPARRVIGAQSQRWGDANALTISLHSGASWSIPTPSERQADAESFAREVGEAIPSQPTSPPGATGPCCFPNR